MPEIVNPDFQEKAAAWLREEVYSKTKVGLDCKLLESVRVRREEDGRFKLKRINRLFQNR